VFGLHRLNYQAFLHCILVLYLKFILYKISGYPVFSLDRFHCSRFVPLLASFVLAIKFIAEVLFTLTVISDMYLPFS